MIDMKYKVIVSKKVGVLPNISYKPVFEREFEFNRQEIGMHCDLELMADSFRILFPNRDDYKVTFECY